MESLKASFLALFKEWELNRTVGISLLTSIQRSLELLHTVPSSSKASSPKEVEIRERLLALCPSSSLKNYFAGTLHREDRESQRAALELQDNYILLQTCVKKATRLANEMDDLVTRASQSASSSEKNDVGEEAGGEQMQQGEEEGGHEDPGFKAGHPSARSDDEILLMMFALVSALIVESHEVMGRISSSIGLETPSDEMFGYLEMWKLAPFLDEVLVSDLTTSLGGSH